MLSKDQRIKLDAIVHTKCHIKSRADTDGMSAYDIEDIMLGSLRYESLRRLNAQQFQALCLKNISTGTPFDELVDELIVKDAEDRKEI